MATGDIITAPVQNARFDFNQDGIEPYIKHISGNVVAISFCGGLVAAWCRLRTANVNNDGTFNFLASVNIFGGAQSCQNSHITQVSGDVYAIAANNQLPLDTVGYIETVSISADGLTLNTLFGPFQFTATCADESHPLLKLANGQYAVFFRDSATGAGWIQTLSITNDGLNLALINNLQFDAGADSIDVVPISSDATGDIIAIFYRATAAGNIGRMRTVHISADGTVITLINFATFYANARFCRACAVTGDIYAVAHQGPGNDGFLTTVSISSDGATIAPVATLEFDGANCVMNDIIPVGADIYSVFYQGVGNWGYVVTIDISNDGVTIAIHDGPDNWLAAFALYQRVERIPGTEIYALAHTEAGNDGWLATFNIESTYLPTAQTNPATGVMVQATLNGMLADEGLLPCEARFQYGTSPSMGTYTAWQGGLRTNDTFEQLITGLDGSRTYYFRAECRNAVGAGTPGSTLSFTTPYAVAEVDIMGPTGITEHCATLNGMVIEHGNRPGSVRFHYGTTTSYGMTTAWQNGFSSGDIFSADISQLAPEAQYHARAEFYSSPPVFSRDIAFSTLADEGGIALIEDELLNLLEVS